MQGSQDFGSRSLERAVELKQEADRLKEVTRRGQLECRSAMIPVDGVPTNFTVYEVDGGRCRPGGGAPLALWAAYGVLPTVDLIMDSWGVPVEGLALVRMIGPIPPPSRFSSSPWAESQ
jgi:hypothetical protein